MKIGILSFFVFLLMTSCKQNPHYLVKIEGKQIPVSADIISDSTLEYFIKPYKDKVEKEMKTVLSYTSKDLIKSDGKLESSLGNLLADLCYQRANPVFNSRTGKNIDFVMFNHGGVRAGISKGPITVEHAFKLMPFENNLVVVEITFEKLIELVEYLIQGKRAHPLSSQINLIIKKNGYDLSINGSALDKKTNYYVLTSDYLQNGGDNMIFFSEPVNLYKLDYKVRNAIIDYFKETDTVQSELDGRFSYEN